MKTGVGSPAGVVSVGHGMWNIYSASAARRRGLKLCSEALSEDWSDASPRNLVGLLPWGDQADDAGEPNYLDLLKEKLLGRETSMWEKLREVGTLL